MGKMKRACAAIAAVVLVGVLCELTGLGLHMRSPSVQIVWMRRVREASNGDGAGAAAGDGGGRGGARDAHDVDDVPADSVGVSSGEREVDGDAVATSLTSRGETGLGDVHGANVAIGAVGASKSGDEYDTYMYEDEDEVANVNVARVVDSAAESSSDGASDGASDGDEYDTYVYEKDEVVNSQGAQAVADATDASSSGGASGGLSKKSGDGEQTSSGRRESMAAELQRDDRLAEAAHVLPGGRTVYAGVLLSKMRAFKSFGNCRGSYRCRPRPDMRECAWCRTGGSCIRGSMLANAASARENKMRHVKTQYNDLARMTKAAADTLPRSDKPTMVQVFLWCELEEEMPMNAEGKLFMSLPAGEQGHELMAVAERLKRWPTIVPEGSVALCGRATFAKVNANNIVQLSEYAQMQGFATMYMYNAGATAMLEAHKLEEYMARLAADNSTALRMLDMRNHLELLFGSTSTYAFMSTHSGGQRWLKADCAVRALRDGHAWVLHGDLDEYIFPGKAFIEEDPMLPMAQRLIDLVPDGSIGLTVAALNAKCNRDVGPLADWPIDAAKSAARWQSFMRRVSKHHLDVEVPDPMAHFTIRRMKKSCKDYHLCLDSIGSRKLFVNATVPPHHLRVHGVTKSRDHEVLDLDADVAHLRHYRCIADHGQRPLLLAK